MIDKKESHQERTYVGFILNAKENISLILSQSRRNSNLLENSLTMLYENYTAIPDERILSWHPVYV